MKRRNLLLTMMVMVMFTAASFAQGTITGKVIEADYGEALIGATVVIDGTTTGTVTSLDGVFNFDVAPGTYTLVISYIGYNTKNVQAIVTDGKTENIGRIKMEASSFALEGVNIMADRAKDRETPVAISNITKKEIVDRLGSRDIPLILNMTPSVYATAQGGGAGDARINVRGFNQNNVAIMINGVPVNDMENGWVYWSNWDGISDATASIQMQRGLSAVNLATPSIGGTMNIITSPAEMKKGVSGRFELGSGNFMKSTVTAHTGIINEKFAASVSLVRKVGSGVIDGTWTDSYAYYMGASYNVNKNNRLEVYVMGAPQRHGQNLYKQNIATYDKEFASSLMSYDTSAFGSFVEQGRVYNQNWSPVNSSYQGKQSWNGNNDHSRYSNNFINTRENFFHKPLANLNWYVQWSDKISQFTTVYYSGGKGGGTGTYGSMYRRDGNGVLGGEDYKFYYGPGPWSYDLNEEIAANSGQIDSVYIDKEYIEREDGESVGILRNSRNNQYTIGAISKVRIEWSKTLRTTVGIDWRTAKIEHYREVRDLLGGDFFYNDADEFNPNMKAALGDKIVYNFTNKVNWLGGFIQGEYHTSVMTAYITAGYSIISYQHNNHFIKSTDDPNKELSIKSDNIGGYQVKGGISYRLSETVSIFGNGGIVSKVPILDAVINDRTYALIKDPSNEIFISTELGLNFRSNDHKFNANINLYRTNWNNRLITDPYFDQVGDDDGLFIISDMDAIHQGVELDFAIKPNKYFRLDGAISIGDWKTTNNPTASLEYYETGIDTSFTVYAKDLKTGDAPQTQMAFSATISPTSGMYFIFSLRHYADFYADWNVVNRIDPDDKAQSWKTPAYSVVDLHAGYVLPFDSDKYTVEIFAHVFNLFNTLYIQDAVDDSEFNGYYGGGQHTASSAEVFLGLPRIFNVGLQISFR